MTSTVLAAQLYTVRAFTKTPADIAATFKKVRAIGYEAAQTSALGPIEPKELRKIADGEGVTICATHVGFEKLLANPEAMIEEHKTIGCENVAIGSMPTPARASEAALSQFIKDMESVGRRLAEAGLTFSYHNHSFEFEKFGGKLIFERLYGETDARYVKAELDTYWVQDGGGDPALWIDKLHNRIILLHLKDRTVREAKPTYAEIGEGNLNWPAILRSARGAAVRWYIVEQDTCAGDPFESLAISYRNLRAMGLR